MVLSIHHLSKMPVPFSGVICSPHHKMSCNVKIPPKIQCDLSEHEKLQIDWCCTQLTFKSPIANCVVLNKVKHTSIIQWKSMRGIAQIHSNKLYGIDHPDPIINIQVSINSVCDHTVGLDHWDIMKIQYYNL